MTTSYPTQQNAPTENAQGELVWKPSVGTVFKPAADRAHSYGGIIGALQDEIVTAGTIPKSYPHNFAGIIAAIQDLEQAGQQIPVHPGPIPPGTDIDINTGDLIVVVPPTDGMLWFDTRQGRLFVALDQEWWQTNGADGLAYIRDYTTNPPPIDDVLPGQFWFDPVAQTLFVFNGDEWVLVSTGEAGIDQTTATLPLANTGPRQRIVDTIGEVLPPVDLATLVVQSDLNGYYFECLLALEEAVASVNPVHVGITPPPLEAGEEYVPGQLWYDTESLEMSVWYQDDDTGQWVPTAASYTYDEDLAVLTTALQTETRNREQALHNIHQLLENINASDAEEVHQLTESIEALEAIVETKADKSQLNAYATREHLETEVDDLKISLLDEISEVSDSIPSIEGLALSTELASQKEELEVAISEKTTMAVVTDYVSTTLTTNNYLTQSYLDQSLENLSQSYLTHTGGTLTGSLTINKTQLSKAALDFSSSPQAGMPAFKFVTRTADYSSTYCPTFGTTEKLYELAWNFEGDEDFCWIYNDHSKVFSITKDGPACSTLVLGDIDPDTTNGRIIHNKIDVKERLNTYQNAFEIMRQGVASANDFDTLKANIISALATV